jgi:hypothetical protein
LGLVAESIQLLDLSQFASPGLDSIKHLPRFRVAGEIEAYVCEVSTPYSD